MQNNFVKYLNNETNIAIHILRLHLHFFLYYKITSDVWNKYVKLVETVIQQ